MISFAGKVAVVTGASSGIGRATSLLFSKLGASLVITGRNEENLNKTAELCKKNGVNVFSVTGDITVEETSTKIVEMASKFGKMDALVNNAGQIQLDTIETCTMADMDSMLDVNVRSVFMLSQKSIPLLEKTKGSIVNVSSINGVRAFAGVFSYCIAKAAVDQLTRVAALDLAPKGIRVNAVNPGVIITELQKRGGLDDEAYLKFLERSKTTHALGRPGDADEAANTIAFLASDASSFITGVSLPVDGGRHAMCPR